MQNTLSYCIGLVILATLLSCGNEPAATPETLSFGEPPQWSRQAIWYQLFVERFRNGDPSNDPTLATVQYALEDQVPADWSVTDWGHDWYAQEDWAKATNLDFYRTIQMRRYGGDLAGVKEKLPYLQELGITAIYFNPINDAPSLHKFDARTYRHVDVTFGPDPQKDMETIAAEVPDDPSTWQLTTADSLFFSIVETCHQMGIRVVVDFSWNHTGRSFWAFQDVIEKQEKSKYKDWFEITSFDDAATPENEFEYEGWIGIKSLPDLKKRRDSPKRQGHPYEGDLYEGPKQHIFAVAKKYMDPNGDGDPSDGIDGMRLDVAEHVPMGFWRDFRKHVRAINPDFYLVGECWWTAWPDSLMDPAPWVKGDVFDAVMHYQWYKPTRSYLRQSDDSLSLGEWQHHIDSIFRKYPVYTQEAMMNLGASHDSPRLSTSMANTNAYKYDANPRDEAAYNIAKPSAQDYRLMKLLMLQQFTWKGAPHIWMGDELGMYGADDPDNRKPLIWEDYAYEAETPSSHSSLQYKANVAINTDILETYKSLIALRKTNHSLTSGDFSFIPMDADVMAYERYDPKGDQVIAVCINRNDVRQPCPIKGEVIYTIGEYSDGSLAPRSAMVSRYSNESQ